MKKVTLAALLVSLIFSISQTCFAESTPKEFSLSGIASNMCEHLWERSYQSNGQACKEAVADCEATLEGLLENHIATYNSVYPDHFIETSSGNYSVNSQIYNQAINGKFIYGHIYFVTYQIVQKNGVPLTGKILEDYSYQWTYDILEEEIFENCGGEDVDANQPSQVISVQYEEPTLRQFPRAELTYVVFENDIEVTVPEPNEEPEEESPSDPSISNEADELDPTKVIFTDGNSEGFASRDSLGVAEVSPDSDFALASGCTLNTVNSQELQWPILIMMILGLVPFLRKKYKI